MDKAMERYAIDVRIWIVLVHIATHTLQDLRMPWCKCGPQPPDRPFRRASIACRSGSGQTRCKHKTHKTKSTSALGLFNPLLFLLVFSHCESSFNYREIGLHCNVIIVFSTWVVSEMGWDQFTDSECSVDCRSCCKVKSVG